MTIPEIREAVSNAKADIDRADYLVGEMARLVVGRLKKGDVPNWILSDIKRELADWNIRTRKWKRSAK